MKESLKLILAFISIIGVTTANDLNKETLETEKFEKFKQNLEMKTGTTLTNEQVINFNKEVQSIKNSDNQIAESDKLCYDFYSDNSEDSI